MRLRENVLSSAIALVLVSSFSLSVYADEQSGEEAENTDEAVEEVLVTGTRSKPRTATESTVPIDSFDAQALELQASGDMTESLKNLVPSYTATPLTGDGSAFVRSTSLRGLPPDDVLVLMNSKRRHRSALIQHFGAAMSSGAHASDIGMIPSIAMKNVEVLRDGAAAQYGSDAIAGVINFIMKDYAEGGQVEAQYGHFYEGENSYKLAGNIGLPLSENGFINLSAEYTDNEQLIRGFQPAAAQAAIDAGIPGVGSDSPYPGDTLAQTWGRPENSGLRTAWNMGLDLSDSAEAYMFGNFADTTGNYRFFYRNPNHSSLQDMPLDPTDPSLGNFSWGDTLIAGYTPYLVGDAVDFSNVFGVRGEFSGGTLYDFSGSYGMNRLEYTLYNTLNPSYGPESQRDFQPGDLKQYETNFNADFSTPITDNVSLAYGFEWRRETYVISAGDLQSWSAGPWALVSGLINPETGNYYSTPPVGSNGMSGTTPDAAGSFGRSNIAAYVDSEWDVSEDFLIQTALRFEDFSDFGSTTNGKLAARYTLNDSFTIRGAVSTGFRAPTPGQANYTGIVTTFDGATGLQTQQGTVSPTSDLAISLGGKALDPETSLNLSFGFTALLGESLTLTADIYQITVEDRIAKTQDISVSDNPLFSRVSFYTNALETETKGFDIVAEYGISWDSGSETDLSFAYSYNTTEVTGQNQVNGINPVSESNIFNIENNLPEDRFSATVVHYMNDFTITTRANYYGETIDERNNREPVDSGVVVDFEVNYAVNENWNAMIGASNLFDTYPNEILTRMGNGLAYPRRTPIGYDGGMFYIKTIYNF